jgi:acetyl-CoA/propionyl-CoA carboxylase biotin carboxyl carrier protein
VVEGVPTTIPVHEWILETEAFRDSTHTTTWLEKALADAHLPAQGDLSQGGAPRATRPEDILVEVDGRRIPVRIFDERREAAPKAPAGHGGHGGEHVHGEIRAPMQGTIVKVLVEVGQEVEVGQGVVVLEAMKMENQIAAEKAGTVKEIKVQPGQTVGGGDVVAVIE